MQLERATVCMPYGCSDEFCKGLLVTDGSYRLDAKTTAIAISRAKIWTIRFLAYEVAFLEIIGLGLLYLGLVLM